MKKVKNSILRQVTMTARAERALLAPKLAALGLHPGQDALLLALAAQDGQSLHELATGLAVSAPTITKTINRMSAEGFVEKRASTQDRRQNFAFLTPSGKAAAAAVKTMRKEIEATALAGFDSKQRKRLAKLLRRMAGNLAVPVLPGAEEETEVDSSVA